MPVTRRTQQPVLSSGWQPHHQRWNPIGSSLSLSLYSLPLNVTWWNCFCVPSLMVIRAGKINPPPTSSCLGGKRKRITALHKRRQIAWFDTASVSLSKFLPLRPAIRAFQHQSIPSRQADTWNRGGEQLYVTAVVAPSSWHSPETLVVFFFLLHASYLIAFPYYALFGSAPFLWVRLCTW